VLIPADRPGIQIDIDLLDLLILFQSVYAELTADAAHLITAPWRLCKAGIVAVHPGDARPQLLYPVSSVTPLQQTGKLDTTQLLRIAPLYHCTNLKLLNAWIRKKCMTDFMTSVRSLIVFNLCLKKFEIISILFHRDCRLRLPPVLTSGQPLPETV